MKTLFSWWEDLAVKLLTPFTSTTGVHRIGSLGKSDSPDQRTGLVQFWQVLLLLPAADSINVVPGQ